MDVTPQQTDKIEQEQLNCKLCFVKLVGHVKSQMSEWNRLPSTGSLFNQLLKKLNGVQDRF